MKTKKGLKMKNTTSNTTPKRIVKVAEIILEKFNLTEVLTEKISYEISAQYGAYFAKYAFKTSEEAQELLETLKSSKCDRGLIGYKNLESNQRELYLKISSI